MPRPRPSRPRPKSRTREKASGGPPIGKVVGLEELARLLKKSKTTATSYAARDDFPRPLADLAGSGRVWSTTAVERWAERTLPLDVGRPPANKRRK